VPAVTPELRSRFDEEGYVIFESGIDEEILDCVVAELEDEFVAPGDLQPSFKERLLRRSPTPRFAYADEIRILNAWRGSEDVKAIARAPTVLDFLRDLYGREPLPFQTLNFLRGTQQPPHADAFHFNSDPPGFMCGVWVALEDIDESSGPLVYYPGSQRLPEVRASDVPMRPVEEDYSTYELFVGMTVAEHGLEPRVGTLKKGQALLWSSNLLHGGSFMRDPKSTRRSQVTHYLFSGCNYWTPMLSDEEHTEQRHPVWVT
jgi:ectoine hydroxylase-related dioxygenase (phytanoyl-CoA dioxygenase family)